MIRAKEAVRGHLKMGIIRKLRNPAIRAPKAFAINVVRQILYKAVADWTLHRCNLLILLKTIGSKNK